MRGRYTDLGLFDSAEAAARRYDDYAKFYLKKTAKLNFPEAT